MTDQATIEFSILRIPIDQIAGSIMTKRTADVSEAGPHGPIFMKAATRPKNASVIPNAQSELLTAAFISSFPRTLTSFALALGQRRMRGFVRHCYHVVSENADANDYLFVAIKLLTFRPRAQILVENHP